MVIEVTCREKVRRRSPAYYVLVEQRIADVGAESERDDSRKMRREYRGTYIAYMYVTSDGVRHRQAGGGRWRSSRRLVPLLLASRMDNDSSTVGYSTDADTVQLHAASTTASPPTLD